MGKKKIIIIGAGPAGLTAAYELLKENDKYDVIILEETRRNRWNIKNRKI